MDVIKHIIIAQKLQRRCNKKLRVYRALHKVFLYY